MPSPPLTTPLAAPAASLRCAACDAANRADRKFCAGCGARLWEPCIACTQPNAAVEKHCGSCGANLADVLRREVARVEAELAPAERLAADSLHSQAIDRLLALKIPDHSGLTRLRQTATERVAAFRAEMLRCDEKRNRAIATARERLAAFDYEAAAIALEGVPEPYRTGELRELLDLVRGRQIEVLSLLAEIRRAVAEKRTEGLLSKIEQLLSLKPDHQQARALAERLRPLDYKKKAQSRDALYSAAKTHIDRHDYAAALSHLEQIPDDVRTRELQKLIDDVQTKAAEVAWLSRDLREAVVFDEHLFPIAERLLKLSPGDPDASALISRRAQAPGSGRKPGPSACRLISPPANSTWGPPLEKIDAFHRIDTASLDSAAFNSSPDRFGVAAGLALQALRRALININLAPPEKAGILGLLKSRKKPITSAWGVDMGRSAIKAIRLSLHPGDDRVVAEAADLVEHAHILSAPDVDAQAILRQTLGKLCDRIDLTAAPLCISLPAHKVLFRPFALPLVDEKKLAELMKFEARQQVPFPPEHVVCDYQMLAARATHVEYVRETEVALLALKIEEARAAIAPFSERNLKVDLLTSDAAALLNFVLFDEPSRSHAPRANELQAAPRPESAADNDPVTAILDIGADTTNLMLTSGASLVMRSIPIGGNSFSRLLVKEFQLTFAQAEKVKRNPTAVRHLHRLYAALEPRFADLDQELHRTLDAFLQADPARRLARFVVTGDALKLHAALRRLWHGA